MTTCLEASGGSDSSVQTWGLRSLSTCVPFILCDVLGLVCSVLLNTCYCALSQDVVHRSVHIRSRYTSGRTYLTPHGSGRPFVVEGNLLSARVALLIHLCTARGLRWLLEQPLGTIVNAMPWVQRLWEYVQAWMWIFWPDSTSLLSRVFFCPWAPGLQNYFLDGQLRP